MQYTPYEEGMGAMGCSAGPMGCNTHPMRKVWALWGAMQALWGQCGDIMVLSRGGDVMGVVW